MTVGRQITCGLLLAWLAILAGGSFARAQDSGDEQAVEAGRKALRGSRYPWYDPQRDEVRRIDVRPDSSADSLNRKSQWQSKPPSPPPTIPTLNLNGLGRLMWILLTLAGVALLGLLIWLLVRAFLLRETSIETAASSGDAEDRRADVDRIENLPFAVKRPQSNLRGEAERHFREGNFREAIIYLYSHMLVQLDRHQVIRLTKGKTNRQYLREVRQRPSLTPIFESTMIAFEDVFFGDHTLSRDEFESCWSRLDEFEQLLDQQQQVAA